MTPVLRLLRQSLPTLLALSGVAAVVTAIVVGRMPPAVDVVQTFTVPIPQRPPSGEYEFDGYYALQATDLFAETLAGWLTSPDLVAEVYRRAELPSPAATVRRLAKVFTARKISGQLVELQFRTRSRAEADRLLREIAAVITDRTETFNEEGRGSLTFTVTAGEPLVIPFERSTPLRALIAAFVAVVLGANVVIFWDAFREPHAGAVSARKPE